MKTDKVSKVLIALDNNPTAQKVAEEGYSIANVMNAEVILLHVISDPDYYSLTEQVTITGFAGRKENVSGKVDSADKLKKTALKFLEKSRELLGDKTIKILLKEGECAESILTAAKDLHADLIVMGSHSRKVSSRLIMGRVSKKVLLNSSIPLLIIPAKKINQI